MEKQLGQKLEIFRQEVAKEGEDIVFRVFPSKIIELTELLQGMDDSSSPFHLSHSVGMTDTTVYPPPDLAETTGTKRQRLEDDVKPWQESTSKPSECIQNQYLESVRGNHIMSQTINKTLREESEQLAALSDKVRVWVSLTLPKIEDGDNFGVEVQGEVLGELQRAQEAAFNIRDLPRKDHLARAKICSKMIKYPNVEDYPLALKEHDLKEFYFARQHILDIRNVYALLTDIMHKNITKIRKPKANNSVALY